MIATRAALRALPMLATGLNRSVGEGAKTRRDTVLPIFRGISTPWIAGTWPGRGEDKIAVASAADAAYAAADAASYAASAAAAAFSTADAAAAAAYASAAAYAANASSVAATAADIGADIWAAISADATELESKNAMRVVDLSIQVLWPTGIPKWAADNWLLLKRALLRAGETWEVWTDWYEARLYGAAAAGLPNEFIELARVQIADEIWRQGPKVVNAHIKELIARYEGQATLGPEDGEIPPPKPPSEGPGPHLRPTPQGFEIVPTLPTIDERNDPTQISLHAQLNRRVERLKDAVPRVQNTHKPLFDEFKDYATFAGSDLATLDVPSLWSAGAALNDMVEAIARADSATTMTERLEPDILSQLRSLLRDHTTFIMGFAQGQELATRAAALRLLDIRPADLAQRARGVLAPMLDTSSLLALHARALIQAIDRALDTSDEMTLALIGAAVAAATRSVIAFGRAVVPIVMGTAVASTLTGINVSTLMGDPNAETLRAALTYLVQNANALAAFATHDAQLKVWLDWLISEIRRNKDITDDGHRAV